MLVALATASLSSRASADACDADATYCVTQDAAFSWTAPNGLNVMLDTGWVPGGSPLQVRLYLAATGYAAVDLGGEAGASWPSAIRFGFSPGMGESSVTADYGFELWMRFRFHVRVFGQDFDWEGDIPIGDLPSDLRMLASADFDSFLLPGAAGRPLSVGDSTSDIRIVNFNALGSLIPIPGLSGGIALDARANLDARYQTERVAVEGGIPPLLTAEGASALKRPQGGDYGPALDVVARPTGTLQQIFGVVLSPSIYIDIFGIGFDVDLFSIPIDVLNTTTTVSFPARSFHFPLPDVGNTSGIVLGDLAIGETTEDDVALVNEGEAPLEVTVVAMPEGLTTNVTSLVLGAGESASIPVVFTPGLPGPYDEEIVLATNDPDMPEVVVDVHAFVRMPGEPTMDGGTSDGGVAEDAGYDGGVDPTPASGCGCRTSGEGGTGRGGVLAALVLAIVAARRRARI